MNCNANTTNRTSQNLRLRKSPDSGDEGTPEKRPKTTLESDPCPICLIEIDEEDSFCSPCFHRFHVQCITLSVGYDNRCPVCRSLLFAPCRRTGTRATTAPRRTSRWRPTAPVSARATTSVGSRQATRTAANQRTTNRNQTSTTATSWAARNRIRAAGNRRRTDAFISTAATPTSSRAANTRSGATSAWERTTQRRYAGAAGLRSPNRTQMSAGMIPPRSTLAFGLPSVAMTTSSMSANHQSNARRRGGCDAHGTASRTPTAAGTANTSRSTLGVIGVPTITTTMSSTPGNSESTASADISMPQNVQTNVASMSNTITQNANSTSATASGLDDTNQTGPIIIDAPGLRMIIHQDNHLTAAAVNIQGNEQRQEFKIDIPSCSIS